MAASVWILHIFNRRHWQTHRCYWSWCVQALTAAITSASTGTAQAAAQLQKLAAELLQGRHVSELTSALNLVVYGVKGTQRRTNAAAAAAAAVQSR
jgi:hypothetical protein